MIRAILLLAGLWLAVGGCAESVPTEAALRTIEVRAAFLAEQLSGQPVAGEDGPYPEDYRGHWSNTQEFYVFNTHFFTGSSGYNRAKLNSAKLIMERINALNRFGE